MTFINFHEKIDRNHTSSIKWGLTKELFGAEDVLPMWVADMDIRPPKEVNDSIQARLNHGLYGYTYVPPTTTGAIQTWLKKRHDWQINKSSVLYSPGVVPSIAVAIQAFTHPGDKVMLQSPVYYPFFDMIEHNGRQVVNSPLKLVDGRLEIDFADFEEKLKSGVKLFLLCSPHNPGGTVWKERELLKIGDLCVKYNCLIVSDEIHSDLVFAPHQHRPIAALSNHFKENTITLIAPSKTFNLAGLQASAVIIENTPLRVKFKAIQQSQGFFTLNTFGIIAMEAAYQHGENWLEQLLEYLKENIQIAQSFINENLPEISFIEPEATYLIWLDCRKLGLTDAELKEKLLTKGKLALEPGPKFRAGGEGFVRMNIACSREVLLDGLARLNKAFS